MTEATSNKLQRWAYPFLATDGKEIQDAQIFFNALADAEDGYYPIGANGLWHGGIHFDRSIGQHLKQGEGVRCIADGEVVAYRFNQQCPTIEYPSDGRKMLYSTGFTLVRHRLELPPAPSSAASTSITTPEPALTFFSLYMHLRDWHSYETDAALSHPAYWGGPCDRYVVGNKANDVEPVLAPGQIGLRIRDAEGNAVGLVVRGSKIKLGAVDPKRPQYRQLSEVLLGEDIQSSDVVGYVYVPELDAEAAPDSAALDQVYVLPHPKPIKAGELIGHLGEYQRHQDADVISLPGSPKRPLLHLEIFTADNIVSFVQQSRRRSAQLPTTQKTLLHIAAGAKLCQPTAADQTLAASTELQPLDDDATGPWIKVQVLRNRILVRSALGYYQSHGAQPGTYLYEGRPIRFTGRYVGASDDLVTTDPKIGSDPHLYPRREVQVPIGTVWIERSQLTSTAARPAWSLHPLQVKTGQLRVTVARTVSKAQLSALPTAQQTQDDQGQHWWQIEFGTDQQQTQQGWVCEKDHPQVYWTSPWDWAGFELIRETSPPIKLFSKFLHDHGLGTDPSETQTLKAQADQVDNGPLLTTLKKAIDAQGNRDGQISGDELQKALKRLWLADTLSKLMVEYESEWGGDMSKWDALDSLMLEGEQDWQAEKKRIESLLWWDEIKGVEGFPDSPRVVHFHPLGAVGSFIGCAFSCCEITVPFLERVLQKEGTWFNGKGAGRAYEKEFKSNYSNVYQYDKAAFVELLNSALDRHGIVSCYQKAHFLAQAFHECAHFETTLEFSNGEQYSPDKHRDAIKNENTQIGDGPKYRGRGLIQLTWKKNYRKYSEARGVNFIENPDWIASDMYNAIDASCWFWRNNGAISERHDAKGDINKLVDAEKNNVALITLAVNGGANGLTERREIFERIKAEWELK